MLSAEKEVILMILHHKVIRLLKSFDLSNTKQFVFTNKDDEDINVLSRYLHYGNTMTIDASRLGFKNHYLVFEGYPDIDGKYFELVVTLVNEDERSLL